MGKKAIVAVMFFSMLMMFGSTKAQTINELKVRKQKTAEEISYTNKLLAETGKDSKVTLNKLSILNQQIELRNRLLSDYTYQLALLQSMIDDNQLVVDILSEDLAKIRNDYAKLIAQAYRNRSAYNQLLFLLSSESFNQAYKRLLYTRQIAAYRQRQLVQIDAIRFVLQKKVQDLSVQKKEKEELLSRQKKEYSHLNQEKVQQSDYYKQLKNKEKDLKKLLDQQRKVEEKLQREIERLIAEEAKKSKTVAPTPEEKKLSSNFELNKGKLPWPASNGIITDRFGEHPHPVMKNIIIRNNGIDITTNPGEKARAVFGGTVSKVFAIPGGNLAIIIRHGQYITVYSNLKEVYVKQGDDVSLKQNIGLIYTDYYEANKTILKFQIWKEGTKLDPEVWISR